MMEGHADLLSAVREDAPDDDQVALPLGSAEESLVTSPAITEPEAEIEPARALVLADFQPPRTGPLHTAMRWAYRIGIPGQVLSSPLRKPAKPRLLGTVESPLVGNRSAGVALRAGLFMAGGMKLPLGKLDFGSPSKLAPPFVRSVHGFTWMRDLAASAPRTQCVGTAGDLFASWLQANPQVGKGPAWTVELAGLRLLNWIVHAPILLTGDGERLKTKYLDALETTARWLDRNVTGVDDRLAQAAGWSGIVAAGLLMPDGWARRLYGEAGLLKTLGEMVGEDGGVLSRSPSAQAEAVALLVEVRACYAAAGRAHPAALDTMLGLLVPALLSLRMGDRGVGSWQGSAAMSEETLDAIVTASGVRARPMVEAKQWGYQRIRARDALLVFDAAPPPKPKHARHACASTLAFEYSHGAQRIIVNCGGAELAGALVPSRIEQGLRGTSAHSTLVLDDANSTAILLHGQIGKGVEEVDCTRDTVAQGTKNATRLEAAHNGYAARFGLIHRRILMLSDEGTELRGEDVLEPSGRKGKRGKIGFAMRFHLGRAIEARVTEDGRGVHLAMPDASYWQFRLGGDTGEAACSVEDSLWVDGQGRPHGTQQIVVEGLTARSGGRFPWLLKRMG
ncbi:heparinase [Erythrobacter gaetbuli]|uniref:Heparinase n=1 Tax=Qipengyuania gaetbuli TaxID=266952 RepID=A0A844Y2S0_9SPHN|nr:heparinase II/III-family protein [Qipengyuania gaetbuli]MXO51829.1 heparinase [Qipengyuania gaetbuli]